MGGPQRSPGPEGGLRSPPGWAGSDSVGGSHLLCQALLYSCVWPHTPSPVPSVFAGQGEAGWLTDAECPFLCQL